MDTIQLIGAAMGLGFVSGIRLYATVFLLGIALKFQWLRLPFHMSGLDALDNWGVIAAAAVALCAEFLVDKIPWIDSLWDAFHSFIRPIGAGILAAEGFTGVDSATELILIVLCGGVAFASHSSKAAARFGVNHSPEPFSNILFSLVEDLFVPFGIWLSVEHPAFALFLVIVFLAIFAWVAPKAFRLARLQMVALGAWISGRLPLRPPHRIPSSFGVRPEVLEAMHRIAAHSGPLPEAHLLALAKCDEGKIVPLGLRAAAANNVKGLGNSVGYLAVCERELFFAARRGFGTKVHRIGLGEVVTADWKRGLLMNRLILGTSSGARTFYIFKNVDLRVSINTPEERPEILPPLRAPGCLELHCTKGPLRGSRFPVPPEGFYIGRSSQSAHLIVDSPEVSSRHVRVAPDQESNGLWIEDMNSTNGTYLTAGSVTIRGRQFLKPGSRFILSKGVAEFEVHRK